MTGALGDEQLEQLQNVARHIVKAIKVETTHNAWFEHGDVEKPLVLSGPRVLISSALPGSRRMGALRVDDDMSTWWSFELVVNDRGAWELTALAPRHQYPGWGRRSVTSGKLTDDEALVRLHIRTAAGPLDCLVRDAMRRRGEEPDF